MTDFEKTLLAPCRLCPRRCGVDRLEGQRGVCGATGTFVHVARAGLHAWEEPCISGTNGSGTVFFGGCNLRCIYCQNRAISRDCVGKVYTVSQLAETFLRLQREGAQNINLVTPTHYIPQIRAALRIAKSQGLVLPVVYNCGGYEAPEALRLLEGYVDVYLPDFKYWDPTLAAAASQAADYPEVARAAIAEMVRQTGEAVFDEDGRMLRGVLIRHLLLPGGEKDAEQILGYLYETYGNAVWLSIMNQYTPPPELADPRFARAVSQRDYDAVIDYALDLGITQAFVQEEGTVSESFIPAWDL